MRHRAIRCQLLVGRLARRRGRARAALADEIPRRASMACLAGQCLSVLRLPSRSDPGLVPERAARASPERRPSVARAAPQRRPQRRPRGAPGEPDACLDSHSMAPHRCPNAPPPSGAHGPRRLSGGLVAPERRLSDPRAAPQWRASGGRRSSSAFRSAPEHLRAGRGREEERSRAIACRHARYALGLRSDSRARSRADVPPARWRSSRCGA